MREWVVGFLIDRDTRENVVLISKTRPPWMAGMLNGVGGKIEVRDGPPDLARGRAMTREFLEETAMFVPVGLWHEFARITAVTTEDRAGENTSEPGVIHFFRAFASPGHLRSCESATEEHVDVYRIDRLHELPVVPNLRWLIPLAAHQVDDYERVDIVELSTTLRVPT